ncbi:hypothetical protein DM02DRAFT_611157 [Periconia macrospinosa]|uniref:Uncharacterized protein n=1 Tax=Periconia macrospinosa TaxID=97972 RepID=A0A2V1E2L1_9PLEO|nr:hypothetical protein DM02DRAFT_611157 [Periconia macrospinosa]
MRSVGLSVAGTLLGLYAAGVSASVVCKTGAVEKKWGGVSTIGAANNVCGAHLRDAEFHQEKGQDGVVLSITPVDAETSPSSAAKCADRFAEILKQCSDVPGGTIEADGRLYEIYLHDSASPEKRASKGKDKNKDKNKTKTQAAAPTKTEAAPTKSSEKPTSSSKPSSSSKVESTSKPASSTSKPASSTSKPASSTSKPESSSSKAESSKASSSVASGSATTKVPSGSATGTASGSATKSGASSSTSGSASVSGSATRSSTASSSGITSAPSSSGTSKASSASSGITSSSSRNSTVTATSKASISSSASITSSASRNSTASATSSSAAPSSTDACAYIPGNKKISARSTCQEDEWSRIEAQALEDTSDLVSGCTGKGPKGRSIDALEALESLTRVEKRSGDAFAVMWDKWEEVLKKLDENFGKILGDKAGKEQVTIIWAGGISGVRLGSRGKKGKTGDIDFAYHTKTSEELRAAFKTAIEQTTKEFDGTLNQKQLPISNSLEFRASQEKMQMWTDKAEKNNGPVAFDGKNFKAIDGDWLIQVFGKMTRMYQMRAKLSNQDIKANRKYGQHKPRDEQDVKVFFKQWQASNSGDLKLSDLLGIGKVWGRDQEYVENMVKSTMQLVSPNSAGIEQKLKDLSAAGKC